MDEQTGFAQDLFDVLTIVFENGGVFEKVGGVALDGDRLVGDKFVVGGKSANVFSGSGHLTGEIEFGGSDSGGDKGAIGNALVVFVGRKRKQSFIALDAKVAIPAIGKFQRKGGLFFVKDIFVNKQIGVHLWTSRFFGLV